MKQQQLAAMILAAISAGIIISCSKPADETTSTTADMDTVSDSKAPQHTVSAAENAEVDSDNSTTVVNTSTSTEPTPQSALELSPDTRQQYLTHVIDSHIQPAYKDAAEQSQKLNRLASEHCQSGELDNAKLQLLREQWLKLATAWAKAEMINFGPATNSMSNLYINYYPDERGLVHQGVIDLIDNNPKLTPEQLASESAILQGIPGIEEVLYANETLSEGQCHYIISASSALSKRLDDVKQAWITSPNEMLGINDNVDDASDLDAANAANDLGMNRWINSLLSLVETTKGNSLDKPLGLTGNKKGHLPAAAAGQSKAIITAKVAALNDALTDPVLVAILSENDQDTLANDMSTALAEVSALLAGLPEDIADAPAEQQRQLYDKLTELTQLIKRKLMPILGVQVGFNSTDGD